MPIPRPTSDPGAANIGSAAHLPTGTVTFLMTDIEGLDEAASDAW